MTLNESLSDHQQHKNIRASSHAHIYSYVGDGYLDSHLDFCGFVVTLKSLHEDKLLEV